MDYSMDVNALIINPFFYQKLRTETRSQVTEYLYLVLFGLVTSRGASWIIYLLINNYILRKEELL